MASSAPLACRGKDGAFPRFTPNDIGKNFKRWNSFCWGDRSYMDEAVRFEGFTDGGLLKFSRRDPFDRFDPINGRRFFTLSSEWDDGQWVVVKDLVIKVSKNILN